MYHWWNFHQAPDGTYSNLHNIKVNGQSIEDGTVTAEESSLLPLLWLSWRGLFASVDSQCRWNSSILEKDAW